MESPAGGALAADLEFLAPAVERVGTHQERRPHFLQAADPERGHRVGESRNRWRLHRRHEQMQVVLRRLVEHVARIRLSRRVLQSEIVTKPVLRPHRVVESERNARLIADAVERPDSGHLSGRRLVGGLVGAQVIQDVQQRHAVLVLRKVEQRAVRSLHVVQPGIRTRGLLSLGRPGPNH